MASLRKDPRGFSKYWYACITVPGKGQTQRCTKVVATEKNRGEAMAIAERWEREAKHLGPAVHLENRSAVLEAFVSATQRAIAGEFTEADGREMLDRLLEATGQGAIKNESARIFSNRWLEAQKVALAKTSKDSYDLAVRLFMEHLGSSADKPLRAVRPEQIETFKTARIQMGVAAKTVDRDLKVIRSIFRSAIKQGLLNFDPSQTVSLVSRKKKAGSQTVSREIISTEELDAILAAASGDWKTATFIGRYTGARLSDCANMCWKNIKFAKNVVDYIDGKTGKNHVVPIHPRLHAHLSTLSSREDETEFLCPSLTGKETGGKTGLSRKFLKIMAKAGVDERRVECKAVHKVEGKKARTLPKRSFHSVRHSFNSELANAGVPQEVRRDFVGHADNDTNDIYTHRELRVAEEAVAKLK